jgi:hypothetical protein
MSGYWGETGSILDAQGWLHTGDLGCLDQEGFLTITAILTFTIAAWYVLALFVRGFLGSVASSAGWGA